MSSNYGNAPPQMFNPNESEEEKRRRYQAEALRSSASDEQVKSAQADYDRLEARTQGAGPQGRTTGSRNTYTAASPFEQIGRAHV